MKLKVLMVCLGNICRSPLAEGILKAKANPDLIFVDSAGTAGYHVGSPPDPRSIAIGRKYHIDITSQRCRKFMKDDFADFDLILAMDKENYHDICALAPTEKDRQKVRLILEGAGLAFTEVPDPYYGGENGFEQVYQMLDKACDTLLKEQLLPRLINHGK